MSKKGCLLSIVIALIILVVLAACGAICYFSATALEDYEMSSSSEISREVISQNGTDEIAIINIDGMILYQDEVGGMFTTSQASSSRVNSFLEEANQDSDVKAVILDINSPGGTVYASDLIYKKIIEVQKDGLVVVALMRDVAASGGYYIAAPADAIVASPLTITGSIGVRMDMQSLDGLYEKLGIETRTITNSDGDYKTGSGLFDEDPDGEEDRIYQEIVDNAFDRFLNAVVEGRNLNRKEVLKYADGRIMTGEQAKEYKLIDALGGLDQAVIIAEKKAGISDSTLVQYNRYDFWSEFFSYFSNAVNPTAKFFENVGDTPSLQLWYMANE